MIFHLESTLEQQFDRLPAERQVEVLRRCLQIPAAFALPKQHAGLGLRKVSKEGYWEIRVGLDLRVLFCLEKNRARIVLVGNHDEVQKFLKNL